MNEANPQRSGCLKFGCFGCAGLAGLLLLVLLVLGLLQFVSSGPGQMITAEQTQELPASSAEVPSLAQAATSEQLEDAGAATALPLELGEIDFPTSGVGTIRFDLSMGEFSVEPGEEGTEVEVDAEYDSSRFELVKTLTEQENGNWTLTIALEPTRRFMGFGRREESRVDVRLPRGRPLRIEGEFRMGRSELELGGLWLQSFDVEVGMGEHRVYFSDPTPMPMESFAIEGSMGAVRVADLGNASPATVRGRHRMGELRVNLEGAWRNDSQIRVNCGMGQCNVEVPDDVHVVSTGGGVALGEKRVDLPDGDSIPESAPTLEINASGSMGEVRVH